MSREIIAPLPSIAEIADRYPVDAVAVAANQARIERVLLKESCLN